MEQIGFICSWKWRISMKSISSLDNYCTAELLRQFDLTNFPIFHTCKRSLEIVVPNYCVKMLKFSAAILSKNSVKSTFSL